MSDPNITSGGKNVINGLTVNERHEIEDIRIVLSHVIGRINELGRHRSYSTAITKLDEARHWLRDRLDRTPNQ